jgi:hypothetical protein
VINPSSGHKELAVELLESILPQIESFDRAFLYKDAEPVRNPEYEKDIAHGQARIELVQKKLANPDDMTGDPELDAANEADLERMLLNTQNTLESSIAANISLLLNNWRIIRPLRLPSIFPPQVSSLSPPARGGR